MLGCSEFRERGCQNVSCNDGPGTMVLVFDGQSHACDMCDFNPVRSVIRIQECGIGRLGDIMES